MWVTNHQKNPTHNPAAVPVLSVSSDKAEQVVAEAGQGFGGDSWAGFEVVLIGVCRRWSAGSWAGTVLPATSEVIPGISGAEVVCTWLWVCVCVFASTQD